MYIVVYIFSGDSSAGDFRLSNYCQQPPSGFVRFRSRYRLVLADLYWKLSITTTMRRCKSTPTRKAKLLWMTSHYGPTVIQSATEISFHIFIWKRIVQVRVNFSQELGLYIYRHSGIIFVPQAITARRALMHKICTL